MKKIAVTGFHGKLGSLLVQKPNFVPLPCDITDVADIDFCLKQAIKTYGDIDLIVNCAAISDIAACEENYEKSLEVNVHGLDKLHRVFGDNILNISSDYVFSGELVDGELPTEVSDPDPTNAYGFSKLGAETVSKANGGKTIRLSRTVSWEDSDIRIPSHSPRSYPSFMFRNYIHRDFAVEGIVHFAKNYFSLPSLVNFAGIDNISMFDFMLMVVEKVGGDPDLIVRNDVYYPNPPRIKHGGFNMDLAKSLGFPMYTVADTVSRLGGTW